MGIDPTDPRGIEILDEHTIAKRQDDRTLANSFMAQMRLMDPRVRLENFARQACTLIGQAIRDHATTGLDERLAALHAAQWEEDRPRCQYFLDTLVPFVTPEATFTEREFQRLIEGAMHAYGSA